MRRLIGFLAIDNRICVSLSRTKKGFFCIGNLTLMRAANDLRSEILDGMEQRDSVGNSLPLACQNHPGTITNVSNAMDFNKAPNGGYSVPCQARLNCGHCCEQLCHPQEPMHEETIAGRSVRKHAYAVIRAFECVTRTVTNVWSCFQRMFQGVVIPCRCRVIKSLPHFAVQSRVLRCLLLVVIIVPINAERNVQQCAVKKLKRFGLPVVTKTRPNVMLTLRRRNVRDRVKIC